MRKVCENCKNTYIEGDKYCRYCGAPLGKPGFIEDNFATIYGPPPKQRTHTCNNCGYTWNTYLMIDNENWCPECGNRAPAPPDPGSGMYIPTLDIKPDGQVPSSEKTE